MVGLLSRQWLLVAIEILMAADYELARYGDTDLVCWPEFGLQLFLEPSALQSTHACSKRANKFLPMSSWD